MTGLGTYSLRATVVGGFCALLGGLLFSQPAASNTGFTLEENAASIAAAQETFPLGRGLSIRGAEANGITVRYRIVVPPWIDDEPSTLKGATLAIACSNEETRRFLARGGGVELYYFAPYNRAQTVFKVLPAACSLFGSAIESNNENTEIVAMVEGEGLASTLAHVAGTAKPGHLSDHIVLSRVEAEGPLLRLVLSGEPLAGGGEQIVADFTCVDDTLSTLLRAGATIQYQFGEDAKPYTLTQSSCK